MYRPLDKIQTTFFVFNQPSGMHMLPADSPDLPANCGTLIIDATCAPVNIRFPQDISLLNEAREKLETIIYQFCKLYGLPLPRRYMRKARKEYPAFAKAGKHSGKQIRRAVKKQLSHVRRDLKYLDQYMSDGYAPMDWG